MGAPREARQGVTTRSTSTPGARGSPNTRLSPPPSGGPLPTGKAPWGVLRGGQWSARCGGAQGERGQAPNWGCPETSRDRVA